MEKFEHNGFGKRLKSMLKVDFRRMFTMRTFYIIAGACFIMPILILTMTTMFGGEEGATGIETPTTAITTEAEQGAMFENTWQIIGSFSGGAVSDTDIDTSDPAAAMGMSMDITTIHCEIANKFAPVLSRIHNNRDHRKITVIDGKVGFTGGINLADEYINAVEMFGHWKDTAVKLEGEAVRNLMMLFLLNWNAQSKKQPINYAKYMSVQPQSEGENGIVIPFGTGAEPICRDSAGKNIYLNMIHAAKRYLYITTPYLICDREMLSALCLAAQKGVDVRIITPHIPDKKAVFWMTRSNYLVLMRAGVRVFEYTPGFIHAKISCATISLQYVVRSILITARWFTIMNAARGCMKRIVSRI